MRNIFQGNHPNGTDLQLDAKRAVRRLSFTVRRTSLHFPPAVVQVGGANSLCIARIAPRGLSLSPIDRRLVRVCRQGIGTRSEIAALQLFEASCSDVTLRRLPLTCRRAATGGRPRARRARTTASAAVALKSL